MKTIKFVFKSHDIEITAEQNFSDRARESEIKEAYRTWIEEEVNREGYWEVKDV